MFTDFDSVARHYANTKPIAGRRFDTKIENDIRPLGNRNLWAQRIVKTHDNLYGLYEGHTTGLSYDGRDLAISWQRNEDGTFTVRIYNAMGQKGWAYHHKFLRAHLPRGMRLITAANTTEFIETSAGKFYLPRVFGGIESRHLSFTGSVDSSSPLRSVAWRRSGDPIEYTTTRLDKALIARFEQPLKDFYEWFGITAHVLGGQDEHQINNALNEFIPDAWIKYGDLFVNIDKPLSMLVRDVIIDTQHRKRVPFAIMLAQKLGLYVKTYEKIWGADNVIEGHRVYTHLKMPTTPKEAKAVKTKYRKIMYEAAGLYAVEIH